MTLTQREREILELLSQGHSNKEIAIELGISEFTVRGHLHRVFDKTGVRSRVCLVLHATSVGWIEFPSRQDGSFNSPASGNSEQRKSRLSG